MQWSVLTFGKHKGLSLPQVLFRDPDWFFWAIANNVLYGRPGKEAEELIERSRRIKVPINEPKDTEIEYQHEPGGKFCSIRFVKACIPGQRYAVRSKVLDLKYIRECKIYDKRGYRKLIAWIRRHYFRGRNLTKRAVEKFFSDDRNFLLEQ
jgi:hypothetical protein